ncbi:hypothetical protein C8J57DRAFT_1213661 [Mycena rebaudengoi]|nr:hypothetical protein C8J57DRAFT_1213661 [Mycena rebaudengoi]
MNIVHIPLRRTHVGPRPRRASRPRTARVTAGRHPQLAEDNAQDSAPDRARAFAPSPSPAPNPAHGPTTAYRRKPRREVRATPRRDGAGQIAGAATNRPPTTDSSASANHKYARTHARRRKRDRAPYTRPIPSRKRRTPARANARCNASRSDERRMHVAHGVENSGEARHAGYPQQRTRYRTHAASISAGCRSPLQPNPKANPNAEENPTKARKKTEARTASRRGSSGLGHHHRYSHLRRRRCCSRLFTPLGGQHTTKPEDAPKRRARRTAGRAPQVAPTYAKFDGIIGMLCGSKVVACLTIQIWS